jgi:hypothetical protein
MTIVCLAIGPPEYSRAKPMHSVFASVYNLTRPAI